MKEKGISGQVAPGWGLVLAYRRVSALRKSLGCAFLGGPLLWGTACAEGPVETGRAGETIEEGHEVRYFNGDTGEVIEPLAQLDFGDGRRLDFVDVGIDVMPLLSGPAFVKLAALLDSLALGATDLYEQVTGGPAPPVLREAELRVQELHLALAAEALKQPRSESAPEQPQPPRRISEAVRLAGNLAQIEQAIWFYDCQQPWDWDEWFNCTFCVPSVIPWHYDRTWMWVTGSGYSPGDDLNWAGDTVFVYAGGSVYHKFKWRYWYTWSTPIDVYLPVGYYATWSHKNGSTDFDVRSWVSEADGDFYHWCSWADT